jgi:Zn-dependent protease with chaperone function
MALEAGLSRPPVFLVAPYNRIAAGLAFGRRGRPIVQLNAGLVPLFSTDHATFRAVVLHELAHVQNRDIASTYFTVAVWRSFLLVALVPFAVLNFLPDLAAGHDRWAFTDLGNGLIRSMKIQSVVAVAALSALIYLTRAAVLRSREHLADLAAAAHGGEVAAALLRPVGPGSAGGGVRALLRDHPTPTRRLGYLQDPGRRHRFDLGEVFAAGVAISAVCTSARFAIELATRGSLARSYFGILSILVTLSIALLYSGMMAFYFSVIYWRVAAGATSAEVRAPNAVATAAAMAVGVLLGEPLSVAGALGGMRFGAFGTLGTDGNAADGAVCAVLLYLGVLLLARWVRDAAALRLTRQRRPSLRTAYLGTATVAGLAFLCGFCIWYGFHGLAAAGRVGWWTPELAHSLDQPYWPLPGVSWVNAWYEPLEYLAFMPFTPVLLALPWIYVVAIWLRAVPPAEPSPDGSAEPTAALAGPPVRIRLALVTGLCGGLLFVVLMIVLARLVEPWWAQLRHQGVPVGRYVMYGYYHLATALGALVGGTVTALAPRLRITLGLGASFVSGTLATAAMPFAIALARCDSPWTVQRTSACPARLPMGMVAIYPSYFNQIIVRGGLAALAAGLLWTATASAGRKAAPLSRAAPRAGPPAAPAGTTPPSRGLRVAVGLWTAVLTGIALAAMVANGFAFISL